MSLIDNNDVFKKLQNTFKRQIIAAKKADGLGQYNIADKLDDLLFRFAQVQVQNPPLSTEQMQQFMQAINQIASQVSKQEQRLFQVEQKISQLSNQSSQPEQQKDPFSFNNNNLNITTPPGANVNLKSNSPNESNTEVNL